MAIVAQVDLAIESQDLTWRSFVPPTLTISTLSRGFRIELVY